MSKIFSSISMIVLFTVSPGMAQDSAEVISNLNQDAQISGPIADGTRAEPAQKPEPIEFDVIHSTIKRVYVKEAPEMPGLPAPEGTIRVTVQLVKDPGLPEVEVIPPLAASSPDDPAVLARMEEFSEEYLGTQLIFVSATVYDHSRTYLQCYPSGESRKVISGWSNLDFNHFSGFCSYQVKSTDGVMRKYGLLMGVGNEDTEKRAAWLAENDIAYQMPEIPKLPDLEVAGPVFVLDENTDRSDSVILFEDMHRLYRTEGERMKAAYHAREEYYKKRKAYLLENPPKPEDIVIRFWKLIRPKQALPIREEGGTQ